MTLIHLPPAQRFLGSRVAVALSDKLGTQVSVGRVDMGFLNRIIIDDVIILDQRQQEMMKASRLSAKIDLLPLTKGRISISTAQIFGAHLTLYRDSMGAKPNYQFVLDSLASDDTSETPLDLRINSLIMRHSSIRYDQLNAPEANGRLNPDHLRFSDISAHLVLKALKEDSLNLTVKKLSFNEQSGLNVHLLTMHVEASPRQADIQDFVLQLPHSNLTLGDVTARYQFHEGKLQPGSLHYRGSIDDASITTSDLTSFIPDIQSLSNQVNLRSSFSGTDNSIDIHHLQLNTPDGNIDILVNGYLHHWNDHPAWQVHLDKMALSSGNIAFVRERLQGKADIPEMVTRLGSISLTGKAEGLDNTFNAEAQAVSEIGSFKINIDMNEHHAFQGHVESDGIQLNRLFADEKFGETAMNIDFDGRLPAGQTPEINANGTISHLDFQGYQYHNIDISSQYTHPNISGSLTIDDPNIKLTLDGQMTGKGKAKFIRLDANISDFRPALLNLTRQWDDATFSADISADFDASNLNDATGTIDISHLNMTSTNGNYHLKNLILTSGYDDQNQHFLVLKSDFATMLLKGYFDYATLPQSLANLVGDYLPTLPGLPPIRPTDNDFAFQVELFRSDWLNQLTDISLKLEEPLMLSGFINDRQQSVSIMGSCPAFTYDGGQYTNAALHVGNVTDTLRCAIDIVKHMDDGIPLSLSLRAGAADNRLNASFNWDNHAENRMSGTLNTASHFFLAPDGQHTGIINVLPSQLTVQNSLWQVSPAEIIYAKNNVTVSDFSIKHGQQHITVNGRASKSPADSITVDLVDVDVEYVLNLVNFHSVDFGGMASGTAYVSSLFDNPQAEADLTVRDFLFEHGRMGVLKAKAQWDNEKKTIDIDAIANNGPASMTLVSGYIDPSSPGYIDLDIKAIDSPIEFARSFTDSFADRVEGQAQGGVRLYGPLDNINMTGLIVINGELDVRQLNTTYALRSDTIIFIPDDIEIHRCAIYDRDGHKAVVNGYLHHQHLTRMTFDLNIEAENLLAYDFHDFGSDTFYGTVYGTGQVTIQGRPGRVTFDIDVTPEANSTFVYNVSMPDAITNQEFIQWGSLQSSTEGDTNARTSNEASTNIYLNFIIRCTPDATVRLLMDAKTADYITLHGDGTLRASYYNKGSFQMFGTYTVSDGTYDMTIQELIKKSFNFQEGGTIVFGGAPFDAQLNLQAMHTVNGVSLSDLNVGRSFSNNTVRVNCLMNIGGRAQSPQVDFDLTMPTVSADEQQMVRSVINGQQEMNQQVLYLLGIGRFYPQTGNNATAEGQTQQSQTSLAMQSLLSGTISSQLNALLKNVVNNNKWNFGANISTGDEGWNNAEYEGLISGRLLNNRLLLNGQFGYRDRTTTATTSFIGDFDVQYLLTPSGSISIKMYNQTNDRYFTRSSLNTQGLGFILKKDFSSLPDLFGIHRRDSTTHIPPNE